MKAVLASLGLLLMFSPIQAEISKEINVCLNNQCQTVSAYLAYTRKMHHIMVFKDSEGNQMTVEACTAKECRPIESVSRDQLKPNTVTLFQTIKSSNTLLEKDTKTYAFSKKPSGWFWHKITVHASTKEDVGPVIGFGGAFSDAASILYQSMDKDLKKAFIDSYFGESGLAYTLGRVPIGSSDFSCRVRDDNRSDVIPGLKDCDPVLTQYSYADEGAGTLDGFSLAVEDTDFKIPMIHDAIQALDTQKKSLTLFASPWSAPAWMKTNQSMVHGGLLPEYRALWADYFIRFLEAYDERGISFWGLTVQNEPVEEGFLGTKELQTWQTMYSDAEAQADFIEEFLGPALQTYNQQNNKDVKLIVHDDQITTIEKRVGVLMSHGASQYIDGAALHWYMNNLIPFSNDYPKLNNAHNTLNPTGDKQRFILATEACEGYLIGVPGQSGPKLGDWHRGEAYAHDIISDLNHHVTGWTDWNLMLDMQGGPNWAKNYVDAPVLVDIDKQTFYRQPMYYYLGHFSKFILPGSQLMHSSSEGPAPIEAVVYQVPKTETLPEHTVIVVLNRDFTKRHYLIEDMRIQGDNRFINFLLPAHSIQTLVYTLSS